MLRRFTKSQVLLVRVVRMGESEMVLPALVAATAEDEKGQAVARRLGLRRCARF
jgi:hypothetical protein